MYVRIRKGRVLGMNILSKAMQWMENRDSDRALKLIEEQLPDASDDEKFAFIEFYNQWGFYEEALPLLRELIKKYPKESELKVMLANLSIEQDDDQQAIQLLNDIEKDDPFYEQALLLLADLYQAQGLFEVAEQKLLTAKRFNPKEPIIDLALGEFYFSMGNYPSALIYYERLYKQGDKKIANISIPARFAETLAGVGDYETSLSIFQKLKPEEPDLLFTYGLTAYQAEETKLAIDKWKKVLEKDEYFHSVYEWLAKAYEEEKMFEEAYETALRGLQYDEYNKELYYQTGKLAYHLGEIKESEFLLNEALELDAGYMKAALFLVDYYKSDYAYEKIINKITSLKEQDSIDPLLEWELAQAYTEEEKYEEALQIYENIYEDLTNHSDFLKDYGFFLAEQAMTTKALQVFGEYLTMEPFDEEIKEYMDRMEQLRDE